MPQSKFRFALPSLLMILGIGFAIFAFQWITAEMPSNFDYLPMVTFFGGTMLADIVLILVIAIPILGFVYYVLSPHIAKSYLALSKAVRSRTYKTSIMNIGHEFSGIWMIKRAAVPALFAVTTANMLTTVDFIRNYITTPPTGITAFQELIYRISIRLMAGLLIMPLALLIFIPTWMLNDAGIVTHLRRTKLKYRRCPDTMGVGRWISDKMGGYAIVAYPLSVISTHGNDIVIALSNILISPLNLISALLFIALLPGLVMAFIMPIVLLHEAKQNKSRAIVRAFAKKLGATEVRKERLEEIKRGGSRIAVTDVGAIEEGEEEVVTEEDLMISLKKVPKGIKKKNKKKSTKKKKT